MSGIRIVRKPVNRRDLKAHALFEDFVKAVVDVRHGFMAVGGAMHSDEEQVLLDQGSSQADLWGINLRLDCTTDAWIEFDSMINLRPSQGNRSRGVDDPALREQIRALVHALVPA